MKEAFWGILIVALGLFGIVIVNVFQKITMGNDQTYYLLKETTEAAAYDAIDITYYRLNGEVRMVEDKFVENFVRRFAENVTSYTNYYITIEDVNETPPKVSVKVKTSITSLKGDTFGITNRIDGIIEAKYGIEEILDFLGITESEWENRENVNKVKEDTACKITTYGSTEQECITGDLEFTRWGDDGIPETMCNDGTYGEETREVNYKVCECGVWKEEQEEVTATPTKLSNQYVYNWVFKKDGEIRDIDESTKTRVYMDKCTTKIEIYVPKDLRKKEPSSDNSQYELCPSGGTTVNQGQTIILHANYIPSDSSNRAVTWTNSDNTKLTLQYSNPLTDEGYSRASITGKELGTTTITARSTNGKVATCKVTVLDGNVDTVVCKDTTVTVGKEVTIEPTYTPYTATKTAFNYTSSNTSIATINSTTGVAKGNKVGTSTITVTAPNGKKGTCTLTVEEVQNCQLKTKVGYYYEYDEKYCDGTYCRTSCIKWKDQILKGQTPAYTKNKVDYCSITKETTITVYGADCRFAGSTHTCTRWAPIDDPNLLNISFSRNFYVLRSIISRKCLTWDWTPFSCLSVSKKTIEIPCETTKVCVNYQDNPSCVKTDTSGKSCAIVTQKGYVCKSGWTTKGDYCCK